MRAGDLLRQLDRRLLPPLARGLARLAQGRRWPWCSTGTAVLSSPAVLVTACWPPAAAGGDPTVGEVTRVGVADGRLHPRLRAHRPRPSWPRWPTAAGRPGRETYALVIARRLPGARPAGRRRSAASPVSEVFGRVPLPDRQTEIVRIPALRLPGRRARRDGARWPTARTGRPPTTGPGPPRSPAAAPRSASCAPCTTPAPQVARGRGGRLPVALRLRLRGGGPGRPGRAAAAWPPGPGCARSTRRRR